MNSQGFNPLAPSISECPVAVERPIFYYLRNVKNQPLITVCLIKYKEWGYSRGVSICSPSDQFDRQSGQYYAFERADRGLKILVNSEKPPTVKQIKRNRINKRFISLEKINRREAAVVILDLIHYDKEKKEVSTIKMPTLFKISTFDETGLSSFEKELLPKIRR